VQSFWHCFEELQKKRMITACALRKRNAKVSHGGKVVATLSPTQRIKNEAEVFAA